MGKGWLAKRSRWARFGKFQITVILLSGGVFCTGDANASTEGVARGSQALHCEAPSLSFSSTETSAQSIQTGDRTVPVQVKISQQSSKNIERWLQFSRVEPVLNSDNANLGIRLIQRTRVGSPSYALELKRVSKSVPSNLSLNTCEYSLHFSRHTLNLGKETLLSELAHCNCFDQ